MLPVVFAVQDFFFVKLLTILLLAISAVNIMDVFTEHLLYISVHFHIVNNKLQAIFICLLNLLKFNYLINGQLFSQLLINTEIFFFEDEKRNQQEDRICL